MKYALTALCLVLVTTVSGCKKEPNEQVVELEEISAFDVPEQLHWDFCGGQAAQCSEQPDPNVTAYPDFISDKPLFGNIHLPREFHQGLRGQWYYFAIDQTDTEGQDYDRLYFDLNCDLDLTNDKPLVVQKNPPKGAVISQTWLKQQICFECLNLPLPFGDEGVQPLEIMPRFAVDEDGDKFLVFVTTKAFMGKVDIAGRNYDVWLGHNRYISGWFNHPSTALHLIPDGVYDRSLSLFLNRLMEFRKIGNTDYRFSASPSGGKLIVQPYRGKYGILEAQPANRPVKRIGISGALYSGQALFWFGGRLDKYGNRKPVPSCRIPVGDYTAALDIYLDDVHIGTSSNIHLDGRRAGRIDDAPFLGVKIREDKPFILDFSNKPEVLFASPARETRIKPGEQLQIEAVLIDPKLDIMITDHEYGKLALTLVDSDEFYFVLYGIAAGVVIAGGLWLLSWLNCAKRRVFFLISAGVISAITVGLAIFFCAVNLEHRYDDISPSVTIARTNGEIVARGAMPFG